MVEGITCVPAVTGRVLLGATASLTWGIACECDDVTGAEHGQVLWSGVIVLCPSGWVMR